MPSIGVPPQGTSPVPGPPRANGFTLTIVMPAHNEESTIERAVEHVLATSYPCPVQLIVVNDGSTDGTGRKIESISDDRVTSLHHSMNRGKGAAVRTGVAAAKGSHVLIFDADLEYSADDIVPLLLPVMRHRATVVYGTRLLGNNTVFQSFRYAIGNRVLTNVANILFDSALSDLHTCLKLYPRDLFAALNCTEDGFGLDTQLTARALRSGIRPFEVPISYHSRKHTEGKKISWRHGVECLRILLVERFGRRRPYLTASIRLVDQAAKVGRASASATLQTAAQAPLKVVGLGHRD